MSSDFWNGWGHRESSLRVIAAMSALAAAIWIVLLTIRISQAARSGMGNLLVSAIYFLAAATICTAFAGRALGRDTPDVWLLCFFMNVTWAAILPWKTTFGVVGLVVAGASTLLAISGFVLERSSPDQG